jgi:chromosome partitioning protein
MTHRIAIVSSKGGTGKTTTALNLAVSLAEMGRRTLLVDLDPQGCLAFALARTDTEWPGLAEIMLGISRPDEVVVGTKLRELSLLARGRLHPNDTVNYENSLGEQGALSRVLHGVESDYEYVILDAPSGLGRVTHAALAAAQFVLIPAMAEPMAHRGIMQLLQVLDSHRKTGVEGLHLLGLLPTFVRLDFPASLDVLTDLWRQYGAVFETHIPRTDTILRASEQGLPVSFMGGPTSPEARRFSALAREVEEKVRLLSGGTDDQERPARELL